MGVDILLGLQWGDEGKGKIVDFLAPKYDVVARFQGGPNAGHTLEFDGIKHVLHQIPSGIFHKHIVNIIGNGVILDPVIFKNKEAKGLLDYDIDITQNLLISKKAQLILPTHRLLDKAYEEAKGDAKIGSTLKGIGPTYQDKIGRQGIRVGDLLSSNFEKKYKELVDRHKAILRFLGEDFSELEAMEEDFFASVSFFKEFQLVDSEILLNKLLDEGKSVLAEGAQGSLLDVDFGTYPFVTSSTTTAAGACTGLGIAPSRINKVLGIFKAYCTRVGSGPFPTELFDDLGDNLCNVGREYGSTTGRKRRCGWLDLVALKYAVKLNGVTELIMMKTDVLNEFETIKVGVGYKMKDGSELFDLPYDLQEVAEPIYESKKGWNTNINDTKLFSALDSNVHNYISEIESFVNSSVSVVSVGPDRTETILRETELSY